jgi:hypothetical protein
MGLVDYRDAGVAAGTDLFRDRTRDATLTPLPPPERLFTVYTGALSM